MFDPPRWPGVKLTALQPDPNYRCPPTATVRAHW